ncbi:GPI transamidase component [Microbotryomycetes sp. JL201]|nr:GPI transamidase component [Microbotryomycetes sp. JL201]
MNAALRPPREAVNDNSAERRVLVTCFWLVVIVLGVPYWWATTTIERLPLPVSRINRWHDRQPCYILKTVKLDVRASERDRDPLSAVAIDPVFDELDRLAAAKCTKIERSPGEYTVLVSRDENQSRINGRTAHLFAAQPAQSKIIDVAATLLDLRDPALDHRVVNYAPTYKVVFSLLNENSAGGGAVLDWPVEQLLKRWTHYTYSERARATAHVSAAGVTLDPVLHFMLFVPSSRHRPMRFNTTAGANAFITPQRGGVVLMNPPSSRSANELQLEDFSASFALFRQQVRKILGVPSAPSEMPPRLVPDQWQVEAMVRARLTESVKESVDTLTSIVKLVDDIPNMRVGRQVQKRVERAVDELDKVSHLVSNQSFLEQALVHASRSSTLASQAYFDPSMLALLYFPDEHKYAIYTPLFGPVAVPLIVVLIKGIKEWKERKRRTRQSENTGSRVKHE